MTHASRGHDRDVLDQLEQYYDTAPRVASDAEEVGPFTVFVSRQPWPYYARRRLGLDRDITADDVRSVLACQRDLGIAQAIEWVHETTPSLLSAARATDLDVQMSPLLVLTGSPAPRSDDQSLQLDVRVVAADESADLLAGAAVADVAFDNEGTAVGTAGVAERDAQASVPAVARRAESVARLIRSGDTVMAVAVARAGAFGGGVLGSGSYNRRGDVAEVVGVGVLPVARRRGVAAAVTEALVADARVHGVDTVFLSAESEAVARGYRRLGFRDVGTACIVE